MRARLVACGTIAFAKAAIAQNPASLDTIRVTVTRDSARSLLEVPFAITALRPDSIRPGQKHAGLEELLVGVPGVFGASRQNPSQDPRISIRGFGARSAFGVRGVRVLWDGVPLTVADGQTPLDYLDLDAVDRVEIIRGSASSLFGNASGGVISLSSLPDSGASARASHWQESSGLRKSGIRLGSANDRLSASFGANRTSGHGFRDYSRLRASRLSGAVSTVVGNQRWKLHLSSLDMPLAENPGSVTASQMRQDLRTADPLSVRKAAGKTVNHRQVAVSMSRLMKGRELSVLVHGGARNLDNPLPFATVNLNRTSGGIITRTVVPVSLLEKTWITTAGVEAQFQNDDRHERENCVDTPPAPVSSRCPSAGATVGSVRRDQREIVTSAGSYARTELRLSSRVSLSAAARHDLLRFRVRDRMLVATPSNQSGSRFMRATSPMLGVVYRFSRFASAHASVSSAFETPTATELANNPDGTTGLNRVLNPQTSRTFEAGIKGFHASGVQYDVAGYLTDVRDELIPFEIPGGGGRRFFRNAGRTNRSGFESSLSGTQGHATWALAYTRSNFVFDQYVAGNISYSGNRIPGVPKSRLDASLTIRAARTFLSTEMASASSAFVDDLNSERSPSYQTFTVRAGAALPSGRFSVRPVIGVTNLLDRRFSSSLSINAAAGKYYEPASGRLLYGMVQIERR